MYDRNREEVAWVRLVDRQREAENRRPWGQRRPSPRQLLRAMITGAERRWNRLAHLRKPASDVA